MDLRTVASKVVGQMANSAVPFSGPVAESLVTTPHAQTLVGWLDAMARETWDDRPSLMTEQAALKGLLGSATQTAPWDSDGNPVNVSQAGAGARSNFLGIRYGLTCWLDEIMVDSPWPKMLFAEVVQGAFGLQSGRKLCRPEYDSPDVAAM